VAAQQGRVGGESSRRGSSAAELAVVWWCGASCAGDEYANGGAARWLPAWQRMCAIECWHITRVAQGTDSRMGKAKQR
jgi:hypothetical protein